MTKQIITLGLLLSLATGAMAKTLTPAEALARAAGDNGMRRVAAKAKAGSAELVYTAPTEAGDPAVYIFAQKGDGYMVLSADDVAYPVLGYSDKGSVDPSNMAPAMKWWLEEYARQIAWAKERGIKLEAREAKAGRRDIPTMIQTRWDQGKPYNQLCPVVNAERAYTGCVATSMAQIMYYFKYPEVGTGKITYNDDDGCQKRLTWNFEDYPFDWDNMLLNYYEGEYTEEQGLAVAELMKSTGASVKMSYAADASGALSMMPASAFVKYFKYDEGIEYVLRSYVSATRWDEMVYNNLDQVGPVLYGGASMIGGGHSFIVDGYQAETGLYHFNWGWSELSDGYYSLDALNPSSLGTGGGDGGGYNFTQDGVFGIQPPTGNPAVVKPLKITQQGSLGGTLEDGVLTITLEEESQPMWINYSPYDLDVIFGVCIQKQEEKLDGDTIMVPVSEVINLPVGYGASTGVCQPIDLNSLDIENGTYQVTMSTIITNRDNTWQPVQDNYGYSNSFTLTKAGTRYRIQTYPGQFYYIDEIRLDFDLFYGCLAKVHYKVSNKNDIEISRGIAPLLYDESGQMAFIGNSKLLTIQPGETVEGDIITEWYAMSSSSAITADTKFYITCFDETSYRVMLDQIFGEVIMSPNPGVPNVKLSPTLNLEGATYNSLYRRYEVSDPANMHFTAGIDLRSGYLAYPIYVAVLGNYDSTTGQAEVLDYVGENLFLEAGDDIFEFDHYYNFKKAVVGQRYWASLCLGIGSSLYPLTDEVEFRVTSYSGIENVGVDEAPVEYFNLQGLQVDYDTAPAGVYIRRQGDTTEKVIKR